MKPLRLFLTLSLLALVAFGCGQGEKKSDGSDVSAITGPGDGVQISYSLTVSGIPMMPDMNFNYQFMSDGTRARVESESIVPTGEETRTSYLSYITLVQDSMQIYMNTKTKVFAYQTVADVGMVPPSTEYETEITITPTGNTETILGIECSEVDVAVHMPSSTNQDSVFSTVSGKLWISNTFEGYKAYSAFQEHASSIVNTYRFQGSGYLEFLARVGMSRESLNQLYSKVNGFPLKGALEFNLNQGSARGFTMNTILETSKVSPGGIDENVFAVPDDYEEVDLRSVQSIG